MAELLKLPGAPGPAKAREPIADIAAPKKATPPMAVRREMSASTALVDFSAATSSPALWLDAVIAIPPFVVPQVCLSDYGERPQQPHRPVPEDRGRPSIDRQS